MALPLPSPSQFGVDAPADQSGLIIHGTDKIS
jgi:hypothetical protein